MIENVMSYLKSLYMRINCIKVKTLPFFHVKKMNNENNLKVKGSDKIKLIFKFHFYTHFIF
jgi:hypothetical protein